MIDVAIVRNDGQRSIPMLAQAVADAVGVDVSLVRSFHFEIEPNKPARVTASLFMTDAGLVGVCDVIQKQYRLVEVDEAADGYLA